MAVIFSPLSVIRFSLTFWEVVEYLVTGIVILGAIGEYIALIRRAEVAQLL